MADGMTAKERAIQTAEALFTNVNGDHAGRLALISKDGKDLGGWSLSVVAKQIEQAIQAAIEEEREACVMIADEAEYGDDSRHRRAKVASEIRDAIRARGENK